MQFIGLTLRVFTLLGGLDSIGRQKSNISCEDGLRTKRVSKRVNISSFFKVY